MGRGDRRHGSRWGRWLPIGLVFVLLAAAFTSFQYDVARRLGWAESSSEPERIKPPEGLQLPALGAVPPVAPALGTTVAPDPAKVRATLAPYLRDDDLGRHVMASVATPGGPVVLGSRTPTVVPASTLKLLTGVAALAGLGPDRTFDTTVVPGARPDQVVLVGGGDPFLASSPAKPTAYPRPADLTTLARSTAAALRAAGRASVRVDFDDSLFAGPRMEDTWPASYDDVVAPISALWADQAESRTGWGFEDDPASDAAGLFARALRKAGVKVAGKPRRVQADPAAEPLATVQSPPVRDVVSRVIAVSDNEGAEVLARHVAIAEKLPGTFDGGVRGVTAVLGRLGVALRPGEVIHDGSGLSRANRLSAATLLDVLALASAADRPDLRAAVTGLPVAGYTGSLATRFDEAEPAGRGRVRAKTGTLSGVHGLAGVTTDLDGNVLSFVLLADRVRLEDTLDARETIDNAAAALGACHCAVASGPPA